MVTDHERDWLWRALMTLEDNDCTQMEQAKILRTMSQLCARSAQKIEDDLVDRVEQRLYNTNTVKGATYA
jgi:hypothetical protein